MGNGVACSTRNPTREFEFSEATEGVGNGRAVGGCLGLGRGVLPGEAGSSFIDLKESACEMFFDPHPCYHSH